MKPMIAYPILAALVAAGILLGCGHNAGTLPDSEARPREREPWLYKDRATGCEYLTSEHDSAITPRIAADGRTHMGCKGN